MPKRGPDSPQPAPMGPVKHAVLTPQPPMQRTHRRRTPLTADEVADAREQERMRKEWDPMYITAAEAREAQRANALTPEVQQRIRYSQRDWPENRMSATEALGPLEPGEGEAYRTEPNSTPAEELFWRPQES